MSLNSKIFFSILLVPPIYPIASTSGQGERGFLRGSLILHIMHYSTINQWGTQKYSQLQTHTQIQIYKYTNIQESFFNIAHNALLHNQSMRYSEILRTTSAHTNTIQYPWEVFNIAHNAQVYNQSNTRKYKHKCNNWEANRNT